MPASTSAALLDVTADTIVDAALEMIVDRGLSALTLRPLAQTLDISVATITARIGTKDALIARVATSLAAREAAFFERWLGIAALAQPDDAAARAALTDLAFRDWLTHARSHVICLVEMVHDRVLRDAPWPALNSWLDQAGSFWSTLIFGTAALADAALGYVLDEAGFALSAEENPRYALLRVVCLQRFADGLRPRPDDRANALLCRLIATLEPQDPPHGDTNDPKRRRIADGAAHLIVSRGMEAVTHRSVAEAAGVPASTVVYHFGARAALVVAGLHAVITHFHVERDRSGQASGTPASEQRGRDLVKATSMIALASLRTPSLIPYALDMRRRRGENIRREQLAWLGLGSEGAFDRATAQVVSVALFGMRIVAMARKCPEYDHARKGFAAVEAWRGHEERKAIAGNGHHDAPQ